MYKYRAVVDSLVRAHRKTYDDEVGVIADQVTQEILLAQVKIVMQPARVMQPAAAKAYTGRLTRNYQKGASRLYEQVHATLLSSSTNLLMNIQRTIAVVKLMDTVH